MKIEISYKAETFFKQLMEYNIRTLTIEEDNFYWNINSIIEDILITPSMSMPVYFLYKQFGRFRD